MVIFSKGNNYLAEIYTNKLRMNSLLIVLPSILSSLGPFLNFKNYL